MTTRVTRVYLLALGISAVGHVALFSSLGRAAHRVQPPRPRTVQLTVLRSIPPVPPPAPVAPPLLPPHRKLTPKARPQPIATDTATASPAPLPAPNQTPPPEPPKFPVLPMFGITASSTMSDSSFAVPVGSTLMAEPNSHHARATPQSATVPEYQVTQRPRRIGECVAEYPEAAKKAGVTGRVILDVEVQVDGSVGAVKVVQGIGHGLDEAARTALQRCRFTPARLGDEAVSTRIQYVYTFIIQD